MHLENARTIYHGQLAKLSIHLPRGLTAHTERCPHFFWMPALGKPRRDFFFFFFFFDLVPRTGRSTFVCPLPGTRATIEVHHFFSNTTPHFGSLRPLSQNLTWVNRMKKSHGPGTQRRIMQKKNGLLFIFFPDDFGLRSPVIQNTFQTKTATSIVGCVPVPKQPAWKNGPGGCTVLRDTKYTVTRPKTDL